MQLSIAKTGCLLFVGLASMAFAGAALAESTAVVDFDTDLAGDAIAAGTEINDVYQGSGITFAWEAGVGDPLLCGSGTDIKADTLVYAARPSSGSDSPTTSPNVVSGCPQATGYTTVRNGPGYVVARFEAPARVVCIDVIQRSSSANDTGELIALGLGDVVVDSDTDSSEACVSGNDDIWGIKFSGDSGFVSFDTLRITYGPIRIDFDHLRDGVTIPNATEVNDLYASQGVLFSRAGGSSGCGASADRVFANSDKPAGFGSDDNAVSVCSASSSAAFSGSSNGVVVASFLTDVVEVCVDSLPVSGSGLAALRVLSESGEVLATVYSSDAGEEETLCSGTVAGIRSAEFAGSGSDRAWFDDFTFEFGGASVNFDEDSQGQEIPGNTVINSTYQGLGVTFHHVGQGTPCGGQLGSVYANPNTAGSITFGSPPNTVSLCAINDAAYSENQNGLIEAYFVADVDSVCIDVRPAQGNARAVMRAYDELGDEIDEAFSSFGAIESLCVEVEGIRSVEFAGASQSKAYFDDLRFVAPVPEPSSSLLGGAAIALLGLMRCPRTRRGC